MPDPTNIEQIQEERAQMARTVVKFAAVRDVLSVLEPERPMTTQGLTYHALLKQLKRVIEAELAPAVPAEPAPAPPEEVSHD